MYLIPCRHVMYSQRRHITDVEIYGKNAEKFLSLTPIFANQKSDSKETRVTFEDNQQSTERYERTFPAYLEVNQIILIYLLFSSSSSSYSS